MQDVIFFIINTGVFFSTLFWYVTRSYVDNMNNYPVYLGIVGSFVVSGVASSSWLYLAHRDSVETNVRQYRLSLLRCFSESLAFNGLSWANFAIAELVWGNLNNNYIDIYALVIGLAGYAIFGPLQIFLEISGNWLPYGTVYDLSFTFLSVGSTALYNLIPNIVSLRITLCIIFGIGVLSFPMEVYRASSNRSFRSILWHTLYQLILFYSFALHTFIWLSYTGLY